MLTALQVFATELAMAEKFVTTPLILPSTRKPLQAKSVPLVRPNNTEFVPESCSLQPSKGQAT